MKTTNKEQHKKTVESVYAKRAKVYSKTGWTKNKNFLKKTVDFADLKKTDIVLEIGIGTGLIATEVQKKVKDLYGIDQSLSMLNQLPPAIKRQNIIHVSAENMPYLDNTFDLAYWRSVIMHLIDPQKIINEAYRVTKKGGRVFFAEPVTLDKSEQKFSHTGLNLKDDTHHFYFTVNDLYQRMSKAGFSGLKHMIYEDNMSFQSWVKGGAVNEKRKKNIWDYYYNAPEKFKKELNIQFTKDDFTFNVKWIIMKGKKI